MPNYNKPAHPAVFAAYDPLRRAYWRPNRAGYTTDIAEAGTYTQKEIDDINSRLTCRQLRAEIPPVQHKEQSNDD